MKHIAATLWLFAGLIAGQTTTCAGQRTSFNDDWLFIKGDPADASNQLAYAVVKDWVKASGAEFTKNSALAIDPPKGNPGDDVSYTETTFDDSGWRSLNLPHDWGIAGPFEQSYPGGTGKLPWWGGAGIASTSRSPPRTLAVGFTWM
jgi:beta-galactosidase